MRNAQVFSYLSASDIGLASGNFIRLREHEGYFHMMIAKPLNKHIVILRGLAADIKYQNHQAQASPTLEIFLHHCTPPPLHRKRDLGVSVSGKIDKRKNLIDHEEIDKLGTPGGIARPGKSFPVHEGIDEGGLAHVRSADKCHLRQEIIRIVEGIGGTLDKFC